jgi:hypothetical protein
MSKEVDFLDLRQRQFYLDNDNGEDHLNITQWKRIDRSRVLVDNTINLRSNDLCLLNGLQLTFCHVYWLGQTPPTALGVYCLLINSYGV